MTPEGSSDFGAGLGDASGGAALTDFINSQLGSGAEGEGQSAKDEGRSVEGEARQEANPETGGQELGAEGAEGDAAGGEAESAAGPMVNIPAAEYNRILEAMARAGVTLDGAAAVPDGDGAPAAQVDSRNAIEGEAALEAFSLTDAEKSALCVDDEGAAALTPLFDRISQRAVKAFEQRAAATTLKALSEGFGKFYVAQKFYDENPGLEQYGEIVNRTIGTVRAQHPEYTSRQIMADVGGLLQTLVPKGEEIAKQLNAAERGTASGIRVPGNMAGGAPSARPQSQTETAILGLGGSGRATDPNLAKFGY